MLMLLLGHGRNLSRIGRALRGGCREGFPLLDKMRHRGKGRLVLRGVMVGFVFGAWGQRCVPKDGVVHRFVFRPGLSLIVVEGCEG